MAFLIWGAVLVVAFIGLMVLLVCIGEALVGDPMKDIY